MGNTFALCEFSYPSRRKHLKTVLTHDQIRLVQDSWDLIKGDLGKVGVIVYSNLFETEPNLRSLFPKIVQMNNDNKLECNIDREMLQRHAVTVMEGLGAAVESLDDSHLLNGVLIAIGQTHVHRHVKPHMLKKLWPSLNHGLQSVLQEEYTKQVAGAWKKVFDYICVYMKIGLEHPDIDPDEPTDAFR